MLLTRNWRAQVRRRGFRLLRSAHATLTLPLRGERELLLRQLRIPHPAKEAKETKPIAARVHPELGGRITTVKMVQDQRSSTPHTSTTTADTAAMARQSQPAARR